MTSVLFQSPAPAHQQTSAPVCLPAQQSPYSILKFKPNYRRIRLIVPGKQEPENARHGITHPAWKTDTKMQEAECKRSLNFETNANR